MKRIENDVMFFWCFVIIAVISMKSSIALEQNELDNVSQNDLVADEVKEKDNKTKMKKKEKEEDDDEKEMGMSLY